MNKEEAALQLWKAWFGFDGNPWITDDYGRTYCFFCVEASPNHSDDCIFVRARSLCEDS